MSQGPAQPCSRLLVSIPHCPTLLPLCCCRFIQGSATHNPYVFYHWRYIDIFIYFSHHTVTIPPVCWTNAAHRNGVPVLGEGKASCKGSPRRILGLPGRTADAGLTTSPGTFITEWTDGEKLCEAFLAGGEEAYHAVSEQLARIAQHYRFDGWLVNVENTLSVSRGCALPASLPPPLPSRCSHTGVLAPCRPVPALSCQVAAVRNLPAFLRHLTAQVHSTVPGGLVIWYDSVLQNGALRWQNELNEENR